MILEFGIIITVIVLLGISIFFYNGKLYKEKCQFSLKESMDLAQLPIVTFTEGKYKLNFLLDTGSTHSHIASSVADKLTGSPIEADYSYTTASGLSTCSKAMDVNLLYKGKTFRTTVFISNTLDESFKEVKNNCGVQLHGILGSDFLEEHKYVLDFSKLIAYSK